VQQPDILRHHQAIPGLVPSGAVQCQHGKRTLGNLRANLLQVQVHGVDVGIRQHQPGPDAPRRTDRAEQVAPAVTLISRRGGAAAAFCPNTAQTALLTNTRFILT
jgi:hypothetical protein